MNTVFDYFDKFLLLSDASKKQILSVIDVVQFSKGAIAVEQGKHNKYIYIIKKGIARGFYQHHNEEVTSTIWQEGEVFGDVMTYISTKPASKSYQLLEDSTVFRIDIERFRALFNLNHEICNLARIVVEQYILKQETDKKRYRDLSASEKFQMFLTDRPGLIHRAKFIHIASMLNMKPETLSRIHSEWIKSQ